MQVVREVEAGGVLIRSMEALKVRHEGVVGLADCQRRLVFIGQRDGGWIGPF
jgi:hypothetical protein